MHSRPERRVVADVTGDIDWRGTQSPAKNMSGYRNSVPKTAATTPFAATAAMNRPIANRAAVASNADRTKPPGCAGAGTR